MMGDFRKIVVQIKRNVVAENNLSLYKFGLISIPAGTSWLLYKEGG